MRKLNLAVFRGSSFVIGAALSVSTLTFGLIESASAQSWPLGQEQIDRGTMDRNRRSRGQTRTVFGSTEEENTNTNNPSLVTHHAGGEGVYLGLIELVDGTIPQQQDAFESAMDAMEWIVIESGLEVTPTGSIIGDRFVPVVINTTGQTGLVLLNQLRIVE